MRGQRNTVRFFPYHGVAAFFFVTAMVFMLSGCGLPTSEYLYPPSDFSYTGGLIRLYHNSYNIDDAASATLFKGYDIYYRIFDTEISADSSYNTLSSSLTYSNIPTVASKYLVLSKRTPSGNAYDNTTPLIPYGTSDSYTYFDLNIYNSTTSTWTIKADDSSTVLSYIVRNRGSATSASTADFYLSSEYNSSDQDYAGSGEIESGNTIYSVFFAVAYGTSSSSPGTDIYSDPVIIEPVEYTAGG